MIKTAGARAFAPLLFDFAKLHFIAGTECHRHVLLSFGGIVDDYNAMYNAPMFMSQRARAELSTSCVQIGESWMALRSIARRDGKLLWKVTPKVHKLQHTVLYSNALNLRYIQVYAEESQVGTTSRIWHRSVRGANASSVQSVVLMKRIMGLLLRYEV
eukprot:6368788-Pyramimonas_sp.AAC.1